MLMFGIVFVGTFLIASFLITGFLITGLFIAGLLITGLLLIIANQAKGPRALPGVDLVGAGDLCVEPIPLRAITLESAGNPGPHFEALGRETHMLTPLG